jgi:hypothetical protein
MAYTHDGKKPVNSKNDPINPGAIEWEYFHYDNWLRPGETIIAHTASIVGGIIVTDSTYLGTMVDDTGTSYDQTYGVEYSATEGATSVTLTHRISTSTTGAVDLGRTDIDRSVIVPVRNPL